MCFEHAGHFGVAGQFTLESDIVFLVIFSGPNFDLKPFYWSSSLFLLTQVLTILCFHSISRAAVLRAPRLSLK